MSITGPDVTDWIKTKVKNDEDAFQAYRSLVWAVGYMLTVFRAEDRVTLFKNLERDVLASAFIVSDEDHEAKLELAKKKAAGSA